MIRLIYFLALLFVVCGCLVDSPTKKYQNHRDNIVNVHDDIKEIEMEEVLISNRAFLYSMNDYLIVTDFRAYDESIHLFNKDNFKHIRSTTYIGQGPDEIAYMGNAGIDNENNILYVTDSGKQKIYYFEIDSLIANPKYRMKKKSDLDASIFPSRYQYINDTLSISLIVEPTGVSGFKQSVAKWNMKTGNITPMKYTHPNIDKKRVYVAANPEKGIYAECYIYHDLMTICDLDGNLICNIYGPNWDNRIPKNVMRYYDRNFFYKEYIIALFSGEVNIKKNENKINFPTKFIIFDTSGNYIKTLETGYKIYDYCMDEKNNRIIMNFDDDIQFGYLDLDEVLE